MSSVSVRALRVLSAPACVFASLSTLPAGFALAQTAVSPVTLDPVVVTANRTAQRLSTVLADVSVLDRQDIERAGVSSVADLLTRLPGVDFARNGGPGTSTSVFIRGNESRHTAVYIDGVRVDSQASGGALWEQIPLDQIDRIEVVRGPAATVYGSDAVAGVVQLFTRRGAGAARPSGSVTFGSYGTMQAQAALSGSTQDLSYSIGASHGTSDGFNATKPGAYGYNPDKDGWERSSFNAHLGYKLDRVHRLDASFLASNLNSGYDGSATTNDQNINRLRTGQVGWQAQWRREARTQLSLGQTLSTYETQPSFYRTDTTLTNYTLQHEQRVGAHLFTGILERRDDKLVNAATTYTPEFGGKRHQDAIGLGWRGDFGAHELQAQVRHDDDSEFDGKTTGSLAWGWTFAPQWRVTAATASSFRVPTLYQRFSEYGNPDLVPELGRNVELGLRWGNVEQELSLTAWRNKVSNLIIFGASGPCSSLIGCYENVGSAVLKGVTLAGHTKLGGVTLNGSMDWHDPRNADTDKVLARRARRIATLGAESNVAGWTLGGEVRAVGRRFENAGNTQALGGYAVVNLFVSKVLTPALTLNARLDNVGDKDYELARFYQTPGRNFQVSLLWAL